MADRASEKAYAALSPVWVEGSEAVKRNECVAWSFHASYPSIAS